MVCGGSGGVPDLVRESDDARLLDIAGNAVGGGGGCEQRCVVNVGVVEFVVGDGGDSDKDEDEDCDISWSAVPGHT